jgi:transposase, IS5 family
MRQRFEAQLTLGCTPIEEVKIPVKTRSHLAALIAALQYIYVTPEWNERIFKLLSKKITDGKKKTGRSGMSLWEIFVLGQVRLCMNISYDELHYRSNYDTLLRGILGVLPSDYSMGKQYEYQNIYDNVTLVDDELLKEINDVIVEVGHEVFKKKEKAALRLKTDSFVVETDTHFPTDYNLLWDSARKCIDIAVFLREKAGLKDWRKASDWRRNLKGQMRRVGKVNSGGGKNKAKRLEDTVGTYLCKARKLAVKVNDVLDNFIPEKELHFLKMLEMEYYLGMLVKHMNLVERRLLKGEIIPHKEKVFSIFQPYTEWVTKGKLRPNVEIGKKLFVTTDQFNLIVDYQIGERQSDNQLTLEISDRLLAKYPVQSLSVDKGFSDMKDKALLEEFIPEVIMPKKGKRNKEEKAIEQSPAFKKLKNKHSAVESNINELEHRGLDRCPDRTQYNFNRYVGMSVTAYNLHKIGRKVLQDRLAKDKKEATRNKAPAMAA